MKIILDSTPNAPGCYAILSEDEKESILVQVDYDFPGLANSFGWDMTELQHEGENCRHSGTDGTVVCPECGMTAGAFISAAAEWLDSNDGAMVEDPGYFG